MVNDNLKILYNTILTQTISSDGKFIFCGNNFGDVFVQSVEMYYNQENEKNCVKRFSMGNVTINALAFHRDFLIVGYNTGQIVGYKWNENKQLLDKACWEIHIPFCPESYETPDINSFYIDKWSENIYAGCGDNKIYQISLEDGKIVREYKGHRDFIHCVTGSNDIDDKRIFSASEDGSILFWDPNESKPIHKLEPHKNEQINRKEYSKFQGSVAVSKDWLICGGGTKPAMWHLRSLECIKDFEFPGKVHFIEFVDDMILMAGENPTVNQYTFNGDIVVETPTNHPAIYNVVWQEKPKKIMSLAGTSNNLQISLDFRYIDSTIPLYS